MPLKSICEVSSNSSYQKNNVSNGVKGLVLGFLFAASLLLSGQTSNATLDDLENKLREVEAVQIRWDDVDGSPFWVAGPQPNYSRQFGFHVINLNAQEPVTIRLTQEAYLRLRDPSHTLIPSDIEVFVSNGSGLYVEQSFVFSGKDLILNPVNFGDTLVKIKLKSNKKDCIPVGFFISRLEPPAPMAPYRTHLDTSGDCKKLLSHTTGVPESSLLESFYPLCPPQTAKLEVEGPVRLNLVTRYIYDHLDTGHTFMYRVSVWMDGKPYHTAEYIGQPDQNHLYYSGVDPFILTLPDISPLEIPSGKHTLTLQSNGNIFYRLHELEDTGYLLSSVNAPCLKNRPCPPNNSALELKAEAINLLKTPCSRDAMSPSHLEQLAIKLGKDNLWRADGLQSAFLLDERLKKRPDAPDLLLAREQNQGLLTFYRDLFPTKGGGQKTQNFAYGTSWDLRDPRDEGKETFVLDSHKGDLLNHLVKGYFFSAGKSSEEALIYEVPHLQSPSFLRVMVNQQPLKKPQTLWLQYNDNPPFKLKIFPCVDLLSPAYKPTRGLMGLALLKDPESTWGGLFNFYESPAPLLSVGSIEVPLPANVRQIKVWAANITSPPLEVAFQYNVSKPYRLEHRMMLREMGRVKDVEKLFIKALEFVYKHQKENHSSYDCTAFWDHLKDFPETNKQSAMELYNHWLELLRLLINQHKKLITSFGEVDPIFLRPNKTTSDVSEKIKAAEKFFEEKNYREALDVWSEILSISPQEAWRKAHMGRIKALQNLGEKFQLERYLKTIFLKTEDKDFKNQVFPELVALLQQENDNFTLEGVLVERLLQTQDPKLLGHLSTVLLANKYSDLAVDLGHVVNQARQKPEEAVVFSALATNKGHNGERLGEATETKSDFYFWNAQLAQIEGNYEIALENFCKAGSQGEAWRDHLAKGLTIQRHLHASDLKIRKSAIEDWVAWTRDHPGPYEWKSANFLVRKFFQATTVYSSSLDRYAFSYVAAPKIPVQLKLIGPARLQFLIRPLFTSNTPVPYQGWIKIKDNNTNLDLPITYVTPSEELELIGYDSTQLGLSQQYEIAVGPGEHTIEIAPLDVNLVVEPFIKKPIVSLTVLPPLTHEAISLVLNQEWKEQQRSDSLEFTSLQNNTGQGELVNASAAPCLYQIPLKANPALFSQMMTELLKSKKIQSYELPPQEAAIHHLSVLLKEYENNPHEDILIEAKNFFEKNIQYPLLPLIWNRFTQLSSWRLLAIPQRSAGIRSLAKSENWTPDTPDLLVRKNLLNKDEEDYILTGTSPLVVQFYNSDATHLKILSSLAKLLADDLRDISWGYQIDNGETHSVRFSSSNRTDSREIELPPGEHSLRVFLENPTSDTFIKIKLYEKNSQSKTWEKLDIEEKKDYLVATKTDPLVFDIEGPAWLRIDEWVNGKIISKDYFVKEGAQKIEIKAKEGEERLFRVYRRVSRAPNIAKPPIPVSPQYTPVEAVPLSFIEWDRPSPIQGQEVLPLGGQESGTLSLKASLNRNLAFDVITPNKNTDTVDQYAEERATYRYFDEIKRFYWRGDVLTRQRRKGDPSFGAEGMLEYSPIEWPVTLWGLGKGYTQHINNTFLYSGTIEGGLRHKLVFNEKVDQIINLSLLGRALKFDQNAVMQTTPDVDVYTKYLATHPRALNFSYKLQYSPFMDTQLWGQIRGTTTPSLNPVRLDSLTYNLGVHQLAGPFILSIDYGMRHYYKTGNLVRPLPANFVDPNRNFSFNRHFIDFGVTWNKWLKNHDRLEWQLKVTRVIDTNLPTSTSLNQQQRGVKAWIGAVSFTWHFGNGRDFRDFDPLEILFKDVRERDLPPVQIKGKK